MGVKPKLLAIIPARGGSKGVILKNIKPLAGKPLINYTIESAQQSQLIDKLILSSEDDNIIDVAKKTEVEIPFKRPDYLARDNSSSLEVVQHAIKHYENENLYFDAVLLLQPTTPFREKGFIDKAISKFLNGNYDALVSVRPVPHQFNPHWVLEPDKNDYLKISTGEDNMIKRRQELPKAFFRDGSIYITKTEIVKKGSLYGKALGYIQSESELFINIDSVKDWEKAEKLVKHFNASF